MTKQNKTKQKSAPYVQIVVMHYSLQLYTLWRASDIIPHTQVYQKRPVWLANQMNCGGRICSIKEANKKLQSNKSNAVILS